MSDNALVPVMNQIFEQHLARFAQMSTLAPNEVNHVRAVFQQTVPMLSTSMVSRYGGEIPGSVVIQEITNWLNTYGVELVRAERARQQAYMPPVYGGGYPMGQAPIMQLPNYGGGYPMGGMPMGGLPPAGYGAPPGYGYQPGYVPVPSGNQMGMDTMQPPMYASTVPPAPPPPAFTPAPVTAPNAPVVDQGYDSCPLHQKGSHLVSLQDDCGSIGGLYVSDNGDYYTNVCMTLTNPKTTDEVRGIILSQMHQRNTKGSMSVSWEESLPKNVNSKELKALLEHDIDDIADHNTLRAEMSDWLSLFVKSISITDMTSKFFRRLFVELLNRRTVTGMFYNDTVNVCVFDTFEEVLDAYASVSGDETIAKIREQQNFDHVLDLSVLNVIEQLKAMVLSNNILKKEMMGFNVDIQTIKTESDRSGNVKNRPVRIQKQTCLEQLMHPQYPIIGIMMIDESTTVNVVYGKDINGLTVVTKW